MRRTLAIGSALLLALCLMVASASAQAPPRGNDPVALLQRMIALTRDGKYREAIPVSEALIREIDRMGMGRTPLQVQNLVGLADLHRFNSDLGQAETVLQRALSLAESLKTPTQSELAAPLLSLHHLRATQGRFQEAATLLDRLVKLREATLPAGDPELAWTRVTQAGFAQQTGRPDEAVRLLEPALARLRETLGPTHGYVGTTANNLAEAYIALGRYGDAEPLYASALAALRATAGEQSPLAAVALNNLAGLYRLQGRLHEAEDLHRREIAILEAAAGGTERLDLAPSLNNLALTLDDLQRPAEAEAIVRRALAIQRRVLPADHPDIATLLNNLATIVGHAGRTDDAITILREALTIRERVHGATSREVAVSLQNLAAVYLEARRPEDALPIAERALAIGITRFPAGHPDLAGLRLNVGVLLDAVGRHAEARPILEQALAERTAANGTDHPQTILAHVNLAANALDLGDWARAHALAGETMALYERALAPMADARTGAERSDGTLDRIRSIYLIRAIASERLRAARPSEAEALADDAFLALQRDMATASRRALAAARARTQAGGGDAPLVRERQDVAARWHARQALLTAALARPTAERDARAEADARADMLRLAARAAELDQSLSATRPENSILAAPVPLSRRQAQARLGPDDALLVLQPTRLGTLVVALTRDDSRFVGTTLRGRDLEAAVATLRCGLDATAWSNDATRGACAAALPPPASLTALPFDMATAHRLWTALLQPVADLTRGKRLLVVAGGALTTLPLHVLVTAPPPAGLDQTAPQGVAWLALEHPIVMLPAVDALRTAAAPTSRPRRASQPYLGVGNPLLTGADGTDRRAFAVQTCAAALAAGPAGPSPTRVAARASLDVESLRRQTPLPETAYELCTVARQLGASEADVLLGSRATVSGLKALAARGALADYRVLHFATHGLVAGGRTGLEQALAEPALLLTPPAAGTTGARLAADSGLLAASDIASMQLDADWVVLSACNTAAGGRTNAEALSGLARAFFYAGAQSLLVSHWEVDSNAAVRLVTRTFALAPTNRIGRAAALAGAMAELARDADRTKSHPAYWAPFVVAGVE